MNNSQVCPYVNVVNKDERKENIHWLFNVKEVDVKNRILEGCLSGKYDTGCDACNTDICRISEMPHRCYFTMGPLFLDDNNEKHDCDFCVRWCPVKGYHPPKFFDNS
ncbi:MAG: hypothetical protein WD512_03540 [Candidatus Paceibacterota bacterium]